MRGNKDIKEDRGPGYGIGSSEGLNPAYGKLGLRKCHEPGCNNMTHNYRCRSCWLKKQGFVPYERADPAAETGERSSQPSRLFE